MKNDTIYDTLFRKTAFADDQDAFKKLFFEFYPSLCIYARKYISSPETCEDIVQEVFLNLWKNRKDLNIHSSFRNFLITSVINSCTDYLRKQSSHDKYINNYSLSTSAPDPDDVYTIKELEEMLKTALEKLPLNVQIAFNMSRSRKMTYNEIAVEMNISPKTVESYISQALKMLRKELKDYLPLIIFIKYFS